MQGSLPLKDLNGAINCTSKKQSFMNKEDAIKLKDKLNIFKSKINDVAKLIEEDYNKQIDKIKSLSNMENK